MSFNSLSFFLLLILSIGVRYSPFDWQIRKTGLLLLSYAFYATWVPRHLLILWFITFTVWWLGGLLESLESPKIRRLVLVVSICGTLLPLLIFKYLDFGIEILNHGFHVLNLGQVGPAVHLLLPVGISFYTFEAIAYSVDLYRRSLPARGSLLDFGLFLAFFPRMVSGPVMRAGTFLPQCHNPSRVSSQQIASGCTLLIFGLFEKVVLADTIFAPAADRVYAVEASNNILCAWLGTMAFSFQIYFDFAGYSTSAVGIARLLGFALPANFNSPYSATGLSDFWRRWHISLSTWLRDYLYIPLGGNRLSEGRTKINLLLTMSIGGLWHGAGLRFILWGVLHGAYLVGQRSLSNCLRTLVRPAFQLPATFLLVSVGWVFFRATSLGHSWRICGQMLGLTGSAGATLSVGVSLTIAATALAAFTLQWKCRDCTLEAVFDQLGPVGRVFLFVGIMMALLFAPGVNRAFIYFQF